MLPAGHRLLSILITVGALALAAVHVARPQLNIDAVTIVLVVLASLPWLAPIIKSVTLPGGLEFELRDVKEQLNQVATRVSDVERVVFSGDISRDEEKQLTDALRDYSVYMDKLGFTSIDPLPRVHVITETVGSSFDPEAREITLSKSLVQDTEFLFREYTHYVLIAPLGPAEKTLLSQLRFYQLESGVALFYPCSFKRRPLFGSANSASVFGLKTPYLGTLENTLSLKDVPKNDADTGALTAGQVWGAALWTLRGSLGTAVDELVAKAWLATATSSPKQGWADAFCLQLLALIGQTSGSREQDVARANLTGRGLLKKGTPSN